MTTTTSKPKKQANKTNTNTSTLAVWNRWLAVIYAVQGIAILLLSTTKLFSVQTGYLTADPLAAETLNHPVFVTATRHVFDVNLAYLVAAFLFIAAVAHAIVATVYRKRYETALARGVHTVRWLEYALGASTMMVAIAVLAGVADFSTLLLIFVLDVVMSLLGLAMETHNEGRERPQWLTYVVGCIAGVAPWLAVGFYLWSSSTYGGSAVPAFVYWIFASLFILFCGFAVTMYLQYKKIGPWKDYLYSERAYMILGLAAKTLLAWQVFAGTLRP